MKKIYTIAIGILGLLAFGESDLYCCLGPRHYANPPKKKKSYKKTAFTESSSLIKRTRSLPIETSAKKSESSILSTRSLPTKSTNPLLDKLREEIRRTPESEMVLSGKQNEIYDAWLKRGLKIEEIARIIYQVTWGE